MKANFVITAHGHPPLSLSTEIPPGLEEYHIPGSSVFSTVASFGKFLLQVIVLDGFSWIYSVFVIEEDVAFFVHSAKALSVCHINLEGNAEYNVKDLDTFQSNESQFHIVSCPRLCCNSFFKKGHRYILLDILYPPGYLLRVLAFYPTLESFAENIRLSKASMIPGEEVFINAPMADLLYKLIHSPFSPSVRNFHINIARDLLSGLLSVASAAYPKQNKFLISQIAIIHAAKEFIDAHLSEHFTIMQIARKVGMNEQKLKKGFKELFGKGLFEYLLSERLTIAKIQVEQTFKPVKEIAYAAGYKSAGNFSTAFKKEFGKNPMDWRKENNRDNSSAAGRGQEYSHLQSCFSR